MKTITNWHILSYSIQYFINTYKIKCKLMNKFNLLTFQHCNSKISVRPLHTWYVKENGNAEIEIDRLKTEAKNLKNHTPDVLKDLGLDICFLPIFCCMDGITVRIKVVVRLPNILTLSELFHNAKDTKNLCLELS